MRFSLRNGDVDPDVLARSEREEAAELELLPRAAMACCPQSCPQTQFCPQKPAPFAGKTSTATGIRTRVSAVRGRRPSPLDDSGANCLLPSLSRGSRDATVRQWVAAFAGGRSGLCGSARGLWERMFLIWVAPRNAGQLLSSTVPAAVVKLVYTRRSGRRALTGVEVRILSAA
jgi:hypothetical protein